MYYPYETQNGSSDTGYHAYGYTQQPAWPVNGNDVKRKQKKKGAWLKTLALALGCSLLGGAVGAGFAGARTQQAAQLSSGSTTIVESSRTTSPLQISYQNTGELMTAAEVYAANVNSTVGISTTAVVTNYFGYQTSAAASGSGFIISENGYIVTNFHVIENATSIKVTTYDGAQYDAQFIGGDETNDLAVLKINASGLTPVTLGDSSTANVGDDVVAIGNPLGELTFSLTKGSVSALNREVTLSSGVTMNLIQTDAAINSGNSGGALFNLYGEVIGITNAKYSSNSSGEASIDNIGFAIPINTVKTIIRSIIENGYLLKPYIGVTLLQDTDGSVIVKSVEEEQAAAAAGLQAEDIITAVNGKTVKTVTDISAAVTDAGVDGSLVLTIERNGETTELTVTVGERIQEAQTNTGAESASQPGGYSYYGDPFGFSGSARRG